MLKQKKAKNVGWNNPWSLWTIDKSSCSLQSDQQHQMIVRNVIIVVPQFGIELYFSVAMLGYVPIIVGEMHGMNEGDHCDYWHSNACTNDTM